MSDYSIDALITNYVKNEIHPISRENSWVYCYNAFSQARKLRNSNKFDIDYLSLHLFAYLSSWGMLRNSFMLKTDYKAQKGIVNIILDEKYDSLQGINCDDYKHDENIECLFQLKNELSIEYQNIRRNIDGINYVSDTLISKAMLGTLGCVPAYDENFIKGLRSSNISGTTFNEKSIKALVNFYCDCEEEFELTREKEIIRNYPDMKILDMYLWQLGAAQE